MSFNLQALRKLTAEASRQAFSWLKRERAEEQFYAFALCIRDDKAVGPGIYPYGNSDSACKKILAQRSAGDVDPGENELMACKWNAFEWEYQCFQEDAFAEAYNFLWSLYEDVSTPEKLRDFEALVRASMVLALSDLVAEGFFGTEAPPMLFCTIKDSDAAGWLEDDSASRLNSKVAFLTFHHDWIRGQRGGRVLEFSQTRPDSPFRQYLAYVKS